MDIFTGSQPSTYSLEKTKAFGGTRGRPYSQAFEVDTMGTSRKRFRYGTPLYYGGLTKVKRKKFRRFKKRSKRTALKRYQKPELKNCTHALVGGITNLAQGASAPYQYMFPIPIQGTSSFTRVGNMIQIYGLTIKGHVHQPYKTQTDQYFMYTKIRMCVILDRTPGNQTGTLAAGTVFNLANAPNTSWTQSTIKNEYASRYKIIKDIYFDLDGIQGEGYNIDMYIPLKAKETKLVEVGNSGGQTWQDLITNGYMLWLGCGDIEPMTGGDSQEPVRFHLHLKTHFIDA